MKKKLFCILLSLAMVVTMMPMMAITSFAEGIPNPVEETNWTKLSNALQGKESQQTVEGIFTVADDDSRKRTIQLQEDITAGPNDDALIVSTNNQMTDITLDLNGHVLNRGLISPDGIAQNKSLGSVIQMKPNATFTIIDNNPDIEHTGYVDAKGLWHLGIKENLTEPEKVKKFKGGIITGGTGTYFSWSDDYNGGGINLGGNSEFHLYGGNIVGNQADDGGGIFAETEMSIYDSTIANNVASQGGGITNGMFLFIYGANINENTAEELGGAIYNYNRCPMTITAGSFVNNKAKSGAGIFNAGTATLKAEEQKKIVITGNVASCNGEACVGGFENTGTVEISGEIVIKDNMCGETPAAKRCNNLGTISPITIADTLANSCIYFSYINSSREHCAGRLTNNYWTKTSSTNINDYFYYDGSKQSLYMDLNPTDAAMNPGELEVKEVPLNNYRIDVLSADKGKVCAANLYAESGDTVSLTVTPDRGYMIDKVSVTDADGEDVTVSQSSFTMPAKAVTVKATFKRKPIQPALDPVMHSVSLITSDHGMVGVSPSQVEDGGTLTIKATPDEGYEIDKIYVNGVEVNSLVIENVTSDIEVEVTFKKIAKEEPDKPAMTKKAVKKAIGKAQIKCRTKTVKRGTNVRVVVKKVDLKAIKDAGYKVSYKFYRSLKRNTSFKLTKSTKNKNYVQTKGKKGKYYYYKVKLVVKDKKGDVVASTLLKNCKYGCRKFYR